MVSRLVQLVKFVCLRLMFCALPIECASALFLKQIIRSSPEKKTTLNIIKQATEPYHFIDLTHLEESKAPKLRKRKRNDSKQISFKKHDTTINSAKEAVSHVASLQSRIPQVKVVEDEDDYD